MAKQSINQAHADPFQEASLITAVLFRPHTIGQVLKIIIGDCVFQHEPIRNVFSVVVQMYNEGADINGHTVLFRVTKEGKSPDLKKSGVSLTFDMNTPDTDESIYDLAEGLNSMYRRQRAYTDSIRINQSLEKSLTDDDLGEMAYSLYESLTLKGGKSLEKTMKQALDESMDDVEKAVRMRSEGKLPGIPTGSDKIDRLTGGWQEDELIILGGRPGSLKTGVAIDFLLAAARQGNAVGFFSMEMKAKKLALRFIAQISKIAYSKAIKGMLDEEELKRWREAKSELESLPIYFYDDASISDPSKMESVAVEWCRKHNIKMIAVDYLQLMQGKAKGSRYDQITEVSRSLKMMQLKTGIPWLVLAQLARDVDKRDDPRPLVHDLKESGQIEQDANTIIMLFNPEKYATTHNESTKKPLYDEMNPMPSSPFPEYGFYYYFLKRRSDASHIRVERFADPATNRFSDTNIFKPEPVIVQKEIFEQSGFHRNTALDQVAHKFDNEPNKSQELPF